jgi:hypothetical protein
MAGPYLSTDPNAGAAPQNAQSKYLSTDPNAGMSAGQPSTTPPPDREAGNVLENIGAGIAKGAEQTVVPVAEGLNKIPVVGETLAPKAGIDAMKQQSQTQGIGQGMGSALETTGEFMAGDEALSGLLKLSKIPEGVLALAEKYPKTLKAITAAANVAKTSAEGAAQGAIHGEAEGKAKQEAEGGALGGALGESATQIAGELLGAVGQRVGIGTSGEQDALRGFRPGKRNTRFLDDFQTAAPHLQADPAFRDATNLKDQVDAISDVRQNWWKQQVQPWVDKHAAVPLSGIDIRNNIEAKIPESMKKFNPDQAADIQRFANDFMPGQVFALNIGDAERDLEYFNAKLAATGYWNKMTAERAAMLKTNPEAIKASAAADAIRDELYNRLSMVEPGVDMAKLKQTYGALRNVGDELQGRVNVEGRQAPTSLKELVGLIAGVATGGLKGAAAAAIPAIDREANTATRLVGRATRKAATGQEGPIVNTIKKTVGAAGEVAPAAAAVTGENEGRVYFKDSNGGLHSVPAEHLHLAQQVDPNIKIVPAPTNGPQQ